MEDAPGLPGSIPVGDTAPVTLHPMRPTRARCLFMHSASPPCHTDNLHHQPLMAFIKSKFQLEFCYTYTPIGGSCGSRRHNAITAPPLPCSAVGGWVWSSTPPTPLAHQHMAIQLGSAAGALTYGAVYTIHQYVGAQYCTAYGCRLERSGWGGGGGGKLVCVICTCRSR